MITIGFSLRRARRAAASRVASSRWAGLALVLLASLPLAGAAGQARRQLVEERRFGAAETGEVDLSDIRGLVVDPRGVVTLLEYSQQQLHQFGPDGRLIRSVSRKGSGPGEMRGANGLVRAADGRLWVHDPGNQRRTAFTADGAYATQVSAPRSGYGYLWEAAVDAQGRLVELATLRIGNANQTRVLRGAPDATTADTLQVVTCASRRTSAPPQRWRAQWGKQRGMVAAPPFTPMQVSAWDPAGALWCAANDEYRLLRLGFDRLDTLARIERDVAPDRIPEAERDAAIAKAKKQFEGATEVSADYGAVPRTRPFFLSLSVDDAGRLWARRARADTLAIEFDVFSREGRHLATVTGRGRAMQHGPRPVIRDDDVYLVVRDADDVPFVARYRASAP
jgi:hypothetical protein